MPQRDSAAVSPARPAFTPRTSIRSRVLRQFVLLVAFCVTLLGGFAFHTITWLLGVLPEGAAETTYALRSFTFTVLLLSGLLLAFALLLGTLLARNLTRPLHELNRKISNLRPGTWSFPRTIRSGDEAEALDRVISDITGRLRDSYENLEEKIEERTRQLREQSALDRAILESIEYGVLAINDHGTVTDANPAACQLLECDPSDLIGQSGSAALPLLEHKGRMFQGEHPVTHVLTHSTAYHSHPSLHLGLLRSDQTTLPITLLVVPLLLKERSFGALAVFRDETVERQIDYMKSEFISLASHQLRTPLSSIRWYIEMLADEKGSADEQKEYLSEIDTAAKRMANLIEALLHVARLEQGAMTPDKQKVDAIALLKRLVDGWTIAVQDQNTVLDFVPPKSALSLVTDPILLEIVLQNLFTNALKYSPMKKVVHVGLHSDESHVCITVRDEGMGIPPKEQGRIFEKFFRAKNVRAVDTDGTGLGLYIGKTIVESLGGTLTFESAEGKGTTFTVTLPR